MILKKGDSLSNDDYENMRKLCGVTIDAMKKEIFTIKKILKKIKCIISKLNISKLKNSYLISQKASHGSMTWMLLKFTRRLLEYQLKKCNNFLKGKERETISLIREMLIRD